MGITVNLYYEGQDGNARKFAEEMESSGTASAIRNEDGNEKYEYFLSLDNPEKVLLIDSWKNQHAIDLHHSSAMMKKILMLRNKYKLKVTAYRYIDDENGIPAADAGFLKNETTDY